MTNGNIVTDACRTLKTGVSPVCCVDALPSFEYCRDCSCRGLTQLLVDTPSRGKGGEAGE
jgi:hypothetical protein